MTEPSPGGLRSLPRIVDQLAAELVAIFVAAERLLLQLLSDVARRGFNDSGLTAQLNMLSEMRRAAQRVQAAVRLQSGPVAARIIEVAAADGDAAALDALRAAAAGHPMLLRLYLAREAGVTGQGIAAANAIALELAGKLRTVENSLLRFANDAYRAAVADASTRLVLAREGLTPQTTAARAWTELTRLGVTGYTDQAGRRWNLATYVEMATRTAVQRAYNAAHEGRMSSAGIEYFTVSRDGHPCPQCAPFEGAILSAGASGRVTARSVLDGRPTSFTVHATLAEARIAGLFHPNCRHVLQPYLPGVTRAAGPRPWTKADQQRYSDVQQLRYYERQVRESKRVELAALDDLARQRARQRQRRYQAHIREHTQRAGLVRRPRREQLNLGYGQHP